MTYNSIKAQFNINALTSDSSRAVPGYYENQLAVSEPGMVNDYDGAVIGRTADGMTSLKSIEPRTRSQIEAFESLGQQKIGPKSQLGFSLAENQPTSSSIVPQGRQNVNTPETEVYRTLTYNSLKAQFNINDFKILFSGFIGAEVYVFGDFAVFF